MEFLVADRCIGEAPCGSWVQQLFGAAAFVSRVLVDAGTGPGIVVVAQVAGVLLAVLCTWQ